ncbi:MAG: hypothetical protein ACRDSL_07615 [Pseudonocardiaceae bacterium]
MTKPEPQPEAETSRDTATLAATYFRAWKANDWTTLRSVLGFDARPLAPPGDD